MHDHPSVLKLSPICKSQITRGTDSKLHSREFEIRANSFYWEITAAWQLQILQSMKGRLIILIFCFAVGLNPSLFRASAELEVSAGVSIHATTEFYEPLAPCGTWVEVGSYGRCWHPAGVVVGWRPYCNGYWEWTDCGWYWFSDEPWGLGMLPLRHLGP